jgi:hypothetical protein
MDPSPSKHNPDLHYAAPLDELLQKEPKDECNERVDFINFPAQKTLVLMQRQ